MKIRIKTYNGELPSYLTVGKVYEVTHNYENDSDHPCIIGDHGFELVLLVYHCGHLNGGSWEVVE